MENNNGTCVFNMMVECEGCSLKCYNCGWNPAIAEKRIKELKAKWEMESKLR